MEGLRNYSTQPAACLPFGISTIWFWSWPAKKWPMHESVRKFLICIKQKLLYCTWNENRCLQGENLLCHRNIYHCVYSTHSKRDFYYLENWLFIGQLLTSYRKINTTNMTWIFTREMSKMLMHILRNTQHDQQPLGPFHPPNAKFLIVKCVV